MNNRSFLQRAALLLAPALVAASLLPAPALASWGDAVKGSGKMVTEQRTVPEFSAVALSGSFNLVVRQGTQAPVQVVADDNVAPLIETVVESGRDGATLQVRFKKGTSVYTRSNIVVTVTVPTLKALAVAGSGNAKVESFKTPTLKLAVAGSGDIALADVSGDDISATVAGSGDINGSGKAGKLAINIAGSGDVKLMDLRADDVSVKIAGSGDAQVYAAKTLDVNIAGSGDVVYAGEAQVKSKVGGSGGVRKQ